MAKTRTVRISEENYAKVERLAKSDRRSVSNMADVMLDAWPELSVYVAPELSEVQSWGEWDRAPHETDAEYQARNALLNKIAAIPDSASRKR